TGGGLQGERMYVLQRAACKEHQQVDEMTGLADDAASPGRRILGPVVGWYRTGVHRHDEAGRLLPEFEEGLQLARVRGKTAVEAGADDGPEPIGRPFVPRPPDGIQLLAVD